MTEESGRNDLFGAGGLVTQVKSQDIPYLGLRCTECQHSFRDTKVLGRCPRCNGLLDTIFDEDGLAEFSRKQLVDEDRSMWKFSMFLPVKNRAPPVSAGEGGTPLRRLSRSSTNVWVKDETRNPTGTFKDRGASVAVTRISQLGVPRIVVASEGNAGCSFALYSQMARIKCRVYLPGKANPAKVQLTRKLGGRVTLVSGTIADAGIHAAKNSMKTGAYNVSTFVTPFRHDGKGTMALEVSEQLGWESPDFVVYPVGGGVGLIGMWKMFKILQRIGWTRNKPRLVAVQPTGCAPVVRAYNRGQNEVEGWNSPKTIASGLAIPKPLAGKWILRSLRESRALATTVSDREIRNAMLDLAKTNGMIVEPSSAAAFAALPRLRESGALDKSDKVVVIATGSGLKTLERFG